MEEDGTTMTTTARRARTEEDRKEQILAAARAVFDEKGYENATVSDVVHRAGVAQGTFYLYFESKKAAVIALGTQPLEELASRMEAAGAGGASFEESLRAVARVAFEVERANMDLCRLMTQAANLADNLFASMPTYRRIQTAMTAMFQQAMDAGEMIRMDPEMAMVLFHIILSGAMAEASDKRDLGYSERVEEATTQLLVNAFVRHN